MAQVSQEDLQQALNDLETRLVGRLQMFKESQDGVRHVVDTMQENHEELNNNFFEHLSSMEEKLNKGGRRGPATGGRYEGGTCGSKDTNVFYSACPRGLCVPLPAS